MGTNGDIRNRFFSSKARVNNAKRLRKLRNAKLIGMEKSVCLERNTFYFITLTELKTIYPEAKYFHGAKLKTPNINHGFKLTQLRNILNHSKIIKDYCTDNMLMLDIIQSEIDNIFKFDRGFRPDALFVTKTIEGEKLYKTYYRGPTSRPTSAK